MAHPRPSHSPSKYTDSDSTRHGSSPVSCAPVPRLRMPPSSYPYPVFVPLILIVGGFPLLNQEPYPF